MEGTMANITLFAAPFAPKAWAMCDGSILAINTNQALFSLLGTTYGGNGTTNFALPDLRGRMPMGTGNGPALGNYNLGQVGGTENNSMTSANLPAHSHPAMVNIQMPVNNGAANSDVPGSSVYAQAGGNMYNGTAGANQYLGALNVMANLQTMGSSQPIPNMMPYLAMNYVICVQGIYPSRS